MRKLFLAAAALAVAAPAFARAEAAAPVFHDGLDDAIVAAIPHPELVEEIGFGVDRMLGALLDVDVGPIVDAADPYRRGYGHGRPGRTLREMGGRGDPYFEDRLRHNLYATTGAMGRIMDSMTVLAPAMRRSLGELERSMADAMAAPPRRERRERRERRYDPYE
jgi:hypothetical protein